MNTVVEQRVNIDLERRCLLPNTGMISLGGCERHPQHEEDSVFMTPMSSPGAYSNDGNGYSTEIQYFEPSTTAMVHIDTHHLQSLSSSASSSPFMAPGSPCDEQQFCGSPYSPPGSYGNASPHSLSCSSPSGPHGSPAPSSSLPCSEFGSNPYISPSPSVHDIPASSAAAAACGMPMSSGMSMPYSMEDNRLIYCNSTVPTSASGFFPSVNTTQSPHWMDGGAVMPQDFDPAFQEQQQQRQQLPHIQHGAGHMIEIIDQMQHAQQQQQQQQQLESTPLAFYSEGISPSASPEAAHPPVFYPAEIGAIIHPDMQAGAMQFQSPKSKSQKKPPKPKVVVQVNDEHIKDIPTSAQLWEFTLRVLKKPAYHYMVNWENRKEGLFRFHDAPAFAALWGKHRNRPNMTYDKVARALRYYYKRDILNQVGGRLTYRFSKRLGKLYASDD